MSETIDIYSFLELDISHVHGAKGAPLRAYQSPRFLVQVFNNSGEVIRLTVNRTTLDKFGRYEDGISWDELMEIKRRLGYADQWAVEVYPSDKNIVNVQNMRHLWLVDKPTFAWGDDDA